MKLLKKNNIIYIMPKKLKMKGRGIGDFLKKTVWKIGQLNDYLKEKKYAGRLVWALPEISWVPYLGWIATRAAAAGYGKRRKNKK